MVCLEAPARAPLVLRSPVLRLDRMTDLVSTTLFRGLTRRGRSCPQNECRYRPCQQLADLAYIALTKGLPPR